MPSWPAEQGASLRSTMSPVRWRITGQPDAAERGQHELAGLAQRDGRRVDRVEDLDRCTRPRTGAGRRRPRTDRRTSRPPTRPRGRGSARPTGSRSAPARPASRRPARRCRRPLDRRERLAQALLHRHLGEMERVARRAQQRGRAVLAHRLESLDGLHAAERDHERPRLLRALVGRPELDVGAERVGERDAVARPDARPRRARARAGGATRPSRPACRACAAWRRSAARLVQVRVAVEREAQVRPERRGRRLVGEQVLLGRQRQAREVVPAAHSTSPSRRAWNALPSRTCASRPRAGRAAPGRRRGSDHSQIPKKTVSPSPWRRKSIA